MNTPKKLLICDDDVVLIKVIQHILKPDNISVISVNTGCDAQETARKEKPDLILLDLKLPDKDGLEVLREIKKDEALKGIPVIMSSAVESKDEIEKSFELGSIDYIVKPFVPAQMRAKILSYL